MRLVYLTIVNAFALFLVSILWDGFSFQGGWLAPVIAGAVITLLNGLIKPILKFLSFPLVLFSAGLFVIVINAFIIFLTQYLIQVMDISGVVMEVDGLLTYVVAALIFGLANWLIHWFLKE